MKQITITFTALLLLATTAINAQETEESIKKERQKPSLYLPPKGKPESSPKERPPLFLSP